MLACNVMYLNKLIVIYFRGNGNISRFGQKNVISIKNRNRLKIVFVGLISRFFENREN